MARVTPVVSGTTISSANFGNALITDYVSQTDPAAQSVANLDVATLKYGGKPVATTPDLTSHAASATGVHGAGASTLATVANITTHDNAVSGVHGVGVNTVASSADISTHSALTTGVHGAGASTLATVANIATHAALTAAVHGADADNTHFWRGDGVWAVPAGASGAPGSYDYLIKKNGADAEAYNSTGTLVYGGAADAGGIDGADHDAVINAAIGALAGADHEGTVWVQDGDYTISGTTITVYKKTRFIGSSDARLIAASGVNVITIDSAEPAAFENFEIRGFVINTAAQNSHGVYGANLGDQGGWGTPRISNLTIYGVKAAYAGMYLTNIFNMEISNIHIYVDGVAGKGIVIDVDDAKTVDYGNSTFSNIRIEARANDVVCFDVLKDGGAYQAMCLSTLNNLQLFGKGGSYTGTIGLRMDTAKHNTFIGGTIEGCSSYQVYLDDCETNEFHNMHIGTGLNTTGIYLTGYCKRNKINGSYIYTGAAGTVWDDDSTDSTTPNQIAGGCYVGVGAVDITTNTATPTLQTPFVNGTAYNDNGWDVDGVGEYAATFVQLPRGVQKVLRIRVWALAVPAETHGMQLAISVNAGKSNEAYTNEAISVASQTSETLNFAANDVIYWELDSTDDADIADLRGGDSLEVKVTGVAASGDNCATDARIRTVEILYV